MKRIYLLSLALNPASMEHGKHLPAAPRFARGPIEDGVTVPLQRLLMGGSKVTVRQDGHRAGTIAAADGHLYLRDMSDSLTPLSNGQHSVPDVSGLRVDVNLEEKLLTFVIKRTVERNRLTYELDTFSLPEKDSFKNRVKREAVGTEQSRTNFRILALIAATLAAGGAVLAGTRGCSTPPHEEAALAPADEGE